MGYVFCFNRHREAQMAYTCPACERSILSRRNKLCSFCGKPLPSELLFTPAEVEAIEAAERERALAFKLREEKRIADAYRYLSSTD
jgi:predicted amidophosphoribosyltransferase